MRYQLTVDAGVNSETGKRQQVRRRYATEREARAALAEIGDAAVQGRFVPRRTNTVREVCENYLKGRHESPWKCWRLLTLETRMQVCRRNSRL
ncbi:Arm DNA-binding domain-containing protein, partial [Mycolicibacterium agri]|uniref:Arm DNA-binding domain-containing protein n=1 Tax=Mycolicibacterium agri TaxID=36811 RepID=UPI001F2677A5